MASKLQRKAWRIRAARWRERHPIADAWRCHRWNAKQRGIAVEWTFLEFTWWCQDCGYHLLRKEGYEIHRVSDEGPYRAERCFCVKASVNRRLEAVNLRIAKRRRLALQCA